MTAPPKTRLDLVGLRDIATLLDVAPRTPTIWRNRTHRGEMNPPFPEPDGYISGDEGNGGRPVWQRKTVLKWAKATGRLPSQKASTPAAD